VYPNEHITGPIINAAYQLHKQLGPGLIESVYEAVLTQMLERRGFRVERQKPISFEFDGIRFDETFRIDMLVNEQVVVELKAVEKVAPVHLRQLLTYLKIMKLPVGLLINFGEATISDGVRRVLNSQQLAGTSGGADIVNK